MTAARWPRESPLDEGLLVVDPESDRIAVRRVRDLPALVDSRDVVVVNDAATLPASLHGATGGGEPIEARLIASPSIEGGARVTWRAVLFGAGDWRTPTEERAAPPPVRAGDALFFGFGAGRAGLRAVVTEVSAISARLVVLAFDAPPALLWPALYRIGRPVQYTHVAGPLALWHVQTPFASRPWASEMPCAARPLAWDVILGLRARGARFARVTHAAGLSATGDARLDAALPLRESFEVDADAVAAIDAARGQGGRVIAIGTSAVRALESAAQTHGGVLRAARGETDLLVDGGGRLGVASAILTGMHEPGTSHDALLHAFASEALLARARDAAEASGFLGHEFGDSMVILPGALRREAIVQRSAADAVAPC